MPSIKNPVSNKSEFSLNKNLIISDKESVILQDSCPDALTGINDFVSLKETSYNVNDLHYELTKSDNSEFSLNEDLTISDKESIISQDSYPESLAGINAFVSLKEISCIENDFYYELKKNRIKNIHRIVIAHININSIRNKFDFLAEGISGNIDVLLVTETKLDSSFPRAQFFIQGFTDPYRLDRNKHGGGIILYIREDIPSKLIESEGNIESLFVELNIRKKKWLLCGTYNPHYNTISNHLSIIGKKLDILLSKYDHFVCFGDLNAEATEASMIEFCQLYNLKHLIKSPTCYKNIENPKCIDLILTNSAYNFQHSKVIETGLSDFHKMVITVMKNTYPKQTPNIIKYRDYKNFINASFYHDVITKVIPIEPLGKTLCKIKPILEKHAPKKSRYIRANQAPYMNKNLHKEVMKRSRLKNKYLKDKTFENWNSNKKQRNICVYSFRKEKKKYFSNININNVTDNKKFWKTVKPAFSEKSLTTNKITLIEKDDITSTDEAVAHKFNSYFSNVVKNLNIPRDSVELVRVEHVEDPLMNSILKYGKHPSILAIKEFIKDPNVFDFQIVSIEDIENEILSLDLKKTCQENDIPTKLLKNNSGIFSHIIFHDFNQCIVKSIFTDELKVRCDTSF